MNRLDGWKFDEVIEFLKLHDFVFDHDVPGSHEFWVNGSGCLVNINFTKGEYPSRTLETMIRQSEIDKKHWIKYTTLSPSLRKKKKCCN